MTAVRTEAVDTTVVDVLVEAEVAADATAEVVVAADVAAAEVVVDAAAAAAAPEADFSTAKP